MLMPMLPVTNSSWPSTSNGEDSTLSSFWAQRRDLLQVAHRTHHHRVFVSAQPRHHIALAQAAAEAARDLLQQRVADLVAERVIDVLEAVEIDEQRCHLLAGACRLCDRHGQVLGEQVAVRQRGELIVVGEEVQHLLVALALGDVGKHHEVADHRAVGTEVGHIVHLEVLLASVV